MSDDPEKIIKNALNYDPNSAGTEANTNRYVLQKTTNSLRSFFRNDDGTTVDKRTALLTIAFFFAGSVGTLVSMWLRAKFRREQLIRLSEIAGSPSHQAVISRVTARIGTLQQRHQQRYPWLHPSIHKIKSE